MADASRSHRRPARDAQDTSVPLRVGRSSALLEADAQQLRGRGGAKAMRQPGAVDDHVVLGVPGDPGAIDLPGRQRRGPTGRGRRVPVMPEAETRPIAGGSAELACCTGPSTAIESASMEASPRMLRAARGTDPRGTTAASRGHRMWRTVMPPLAIVMANVPLLFPSGTLAGGATASATRPRARSDSCARRRRKLRRLLGQPRHRRDRHLTQQRSSPRRMSSGARRSPLWLGSPCSGSARRATCDEPYR